MHLKLITMLLVALSSYSASSLADGDKHLLCPDEGCTVVTCDSDTCTVYHCENGTCREIGSYENPDSVEDGVTSNSSGLKSESADGKSFSSVDGNGIRPLYGPRGGMDCGQQRCLIKTCSDSQCSLIGFESGQSLLLGSFNNNDTLIDLIAEDFTADQ